MSEITSKLQPDLELILVKSETIWPALKNQRLFITGGTGFFGRWLLESLVFATGKLNLNTEIIVLTRNIDAFKQKAPHLFGYSFLQYQEGDVQDFVFPEGAIDYIVHAATEADAKLNAENPLLMSDTIVAGTRRVLELSRQKQAKGVMLTSSGAVYGQQPSKITHIPEEFTGGPEVTNPYWAYGESKRMAELLGAIYKHHFQVRVKIARCFAFVGPFLPLNTHFAIGNFILDGLNQKPIVIKGDGTPYRSYLYAADLVIWLLHILINGEAGKAYNVGSDEEITIAGLAHKVATSFPEFQEPEILTKANPDLPPQRYVPSVNRAKKELNLAIYTSLEESINKTINFYQQQ